MQDHTICPDCGGIAGADETPHEENCPRFSPFGPVIFKYTREQALEDEVLFDVTETARESGFKFPVAITARVMGEVVAAPSAAVIQGETDIGRLQDILWMLLVAIRLQPGDCDRVHFQVRATDCEGRKIEHRLWSLCGPGDHGEPVVTIMMEGED